MKLSEQLIEKWFLKHLEDIGFRSKYQSGLRKAHLFRLSQTIMENFNRGELVIAPLLDVEKAFDNVWHNGLKYKSFQLGLPTKVTRSSLILMVERVIQEKVNGLLSYTGYRCTKLKDINVYFQTKSCRARGFEHIQFKQSTFEKYNL